MISIDPYIQNCDVLVMGGGIAGMMAAIAAADKGVDVIVAEKADTRRSGSGATGNDHFTCYMPDKHGSLEDYLKHPTPNVRSSVINKDLWRQHAMRSFEVVQDWEKWGINMRPHGDWEFNGQALPGEPIYTLKYDGRDQKPILTKEAKKRGVKIENKSPIIEFLVDEAGAVSGAIALDISKNEPMLKVIQAKTIISATGIGMRLYPSVTPGWICNSCNCPAGTAAGRAAALRIGATLVHMDSLWSHSGPRYMERCGKGTWIGILSNAKGQPISPFIKQATKDYGDPAATVWKEAFTEKNMDGTGPVYMNCTNTAQEDLDYMLWGLQCEGDTGMLDAMKKQGIDLHYDMVEFGKYSVNMQGRGLYVNSKFETTVPGLYSAGDETGNFNMGISGAAVSGRIAGENAAQVALEKEQTVLSLDHPRIKACQEFCSELMSRTNGASWDELNLAVQQIMHDYADTEIPRSQTKLEAGLKYLSDVEAAALKNAHATTSHELMRLLESFNLLTMGKCVIVSALERKETRGTHKRADYTFTNPLYNNKAVTVKVENNHLVTGWITND
ncbi:MAG: FAD-binding protein [Peptococcaceae bacterium]|nr:FAD-binding protein [Peptococcaceae bacterium]